MPKKGFRHSKKSIENAIALVNALGGSTNAVLHFLAIAHAADIKFTLEDFQRVSDKTPLIADLKPSGKYLMEDVHGIGGTPAIMKYLLDGGYLHGDCMTVTGKTLAENLKDANGKTIAKKNTIIEKETIEKITEAKIAQVAVRSVMTCQTPNGICIKCYGKDLGTNKEVQIGTAVGIIAAQSIGDRLPQ